MYVACYRVANTDMHSLHAIFNSDNDYDNYYFTLKTNVVYLSLFHLVHLRPICDV